MEIKELVILRTFLGTKSPSRKVESRENYWKLIGQKGKILDKSNNRVLVLFDCEVDQFELENHNPIKNSLWILISDLEKIITKPNKPS